MSDYTEQEFNEAMARLDGVNYDIDIDGTVYRVLEERDTPFGKGRSYDLDNPLNYYNDLNRLMPLAFKYDAHRNYCADEIGYEAYIRSIKDRLWQIAQEKQE